MRIKEQFNPPLVVLVADYDIAMRQTKGVMF
jgi:hypothetical protein